MIELKGLSVGYGNSDNPVIRALDLSAAAGQFICLLGRNGTGKSTLLRTLAGLQPPLLGEAYLEHQNIHHLKGIERAQQIAVVLTERQFGLGLTVDDVVAMGRQPHTGWQGRLHDSDLACIKNAIATAGASHLLGRYISDLSDGEKQRVLMARAIAQAPKLLLLDEITAFLDLPGRVDTMLLLKRYAVQQQAVIILSSHDLELSMRLADDIWLLDGKGNCLAGKPDQLQKAAMAAAFDTDTVYFSPATHQFELRNG